MTRHVDHIVGATQDEEVTIFVAHRPIEGAVDQLVGHGFPIGVDEALIVPPHGLQIAGRQWAFDGQHAFLVGASELFTGLVVHQFHVVAIHRFAR